MQSNALKFTEKGKITIKGNVFEDNGDFFLELSVIDTGAGIKEADKNKLF